MLAKDAILSIDADGYKDHIDVIQGVMKIVQKQKKKLKKIKVNTPKRRETVAEVSAGAVEKNIAEIEQEIDALEANQMECVDCTVEHATAFSRSVDYSMLRELNVVSNGREIKTRKGKVTVDSGAEDSVWPSSHVSWGNVSPSEDSQKGIGFVAANGERMPNYGTTEVAFEKDGKLRKMNFSVTDCKKPLASVSKIVDKGNRVVFDEDESYILNKKTGEKIALERDRGTYVMVVEFKIDEEGNGSKDFASGFRRHA